MNTIAIIIFVCIILVAVLTAVLISGRGGNLNHIKANKTGDGQYGTAQWATKDELKRNLTFVEYNPEEWRKGFNIPEHQGVILGMEKRGGKVCAYVDTDDNHTMIVSAPGGGKTTAFLFPNLEYAGAVGMPCFVTDTKGDVFRKYAPILNKYYGADTYVIDLRYPLSSASYNFLYLVNKYMDRYAVTKNLADAALAESYAKNVAYTIVHMDGFVNAGQNQFFYTASEGVIAGITLLVSEFCPNPQRHIVSVFKLIRQLMEVDPATLNKKGAIPTLYLTELYQMLPENHTAKDLLAATATTEFKTIASVMSTAMSQMLKFIDKEIEQILCFDDGFNVDEFVKGHSFIFFVIDEKSQTKNFMINLIMRQTYNELLRTAERYPDTRLPNRVYFWADEFGTYSAIDKVDQMFSAGRSRNIFINPFLQSLSQLDKNYKGEVARTIKSSCQNLLFSFQAPLSDDAKKFSELLGTQTVTAGSVSRKNGYINSSSQTSLNMVRKPLMSPDEIMNLHKGQWILKKTGMNPSKMKLCKPEEWKIELDEPPYEVQSRQSREVEYADRQSLMKNISSKYFRGYSQSELTDTKNTISDDYV
ncbi:MAG: type IV secretory system conjugative DNA transfer family protein [Ruminococcus sp.]